MAATDEESLAHDYIDGRNARRHGQLQNDCPYPRLSLNATHWIQGWRDVDREIHEVEAVEAFRIQNDLAFGRLMQIVQQLWREFLKTNHPEVAGSEHSIGPCVSMLVPCTCETGCDWCAGTMKVTKRVRRAIDEQS